MNFKSKYPGARSKAIDLLDKILQFNPIFRLTVDEALEHPLFRRVRDKKKEEIAKKTIRLSIDEIGPDKTLTKDLLRGFFIETYMMFQNRR